MTAKNKVVLAYSGGLDTSIMIHWLKEHYDCEVIAMCANLGQADELEGLEERALASGASKVFIEDLTEEFITDYIYPSVCAGAIYERRYLLGTSFARPLIAKRQVEIALQENANMVAHGATGKGNDQVRFELTYMALAPQLKIIAPWKDPKWDLDSREACIDYAEKHGIPIKQSVKRIYSEDRNIWHISHEGAELEDPGTAPHDDVYTLSSTIESAPDTPEYIELNLENGILSKVNGESGTARALLEDLNRIGSKHGIGQIDMVENRLVGIKSRGVYETPGGTILLAAYQELETLVLDRDTLKMKQQIGLTYAELVYDGKWFSQTREALDGFVEKLNEVMTGTIRLKLYKGNVVPAGVNSPNSLYSEELASFADSDLYDQQDANGFITLFGLPLKVRGALKRRKGQS